MLEATLVSTRSRREEEKQPPKHTEDWNRTTDRPVMRQAPQAGMGNVCPLSLSLFSLVVDLSHSDDLTRSDYTVHPQTTGGMHHVGRDVSTPCPLLRRRTKPKKRTHLF